MSHKLQLLNLVSTNLEDASNIPAELHREVENNIIENLYPPTKVDTNGVTPSVFALTSTAIDTYRISTKKQGNIVYVTGYFNPNSYGSVGVAMFTIIDNEYMPHLNNSFFGLGTTQTGNVFPLTMHQGSLRFAVTQDYGSVIPILENVYFNIFYFAE